VSWKGSAGRKGQRGRENSLPSKTSPRVLSQASPGLGYPSTKNVNCCVSCLSFQSFSAVKTHWEWERRAKRVRGMPAKGWGSPSGWSSLRREARGIPRDTPAFSTLLCPEADTLVFLQANPRRRVSPDNVGISGDSQGQTRSPLHDCYNGSCTNCVRWRREKSDSTHHRGISRK